MLIINFKNTPGDIITYVLNELSKSDLLPYLTTVYTTDNLQIEKGLNTDYLALNLKNLTTDLGSTEYFNIIDLPRIPIIILPKDREIREKLEATLKSFKIPHLDSSEMKLTHELPLDSPLSLGVIHEIYEGVANESYRPSRYQNTMEINKEGNIILNGINKPNYKDYLWYAVLGDLEYYAPQASNEFMTDTLVSPIPYLLHPNPRALSEEIQNFKINIFTRVVDLTVDEIIKLPRNTLDVLKDNSYIPLRDVEKLKELEQTNIS